MAYELPLAQFLGLEGIALLRAFNGEYGQDFLEARIEEIRRMLDDPALNRAGEDVEKFDTVTGYKGWAATYDTTTSDVIRYEEPVIDRMLKGLPRGGTALDAGCGTGRHTARLLRAGHNVIGVDSSPEMLAQSRAKFPEADLRLGTVDDLPVPDASIDIVVCGLVFSHLPTARIAPVIAEFARVLRPGGRLLISDIHHEVALRGLIVPIRSEGKIGRLPSHRHYASDFLKPALAHKLALRACEEPRVALRAEPEGRSPSSTVTKDSLFAHAPAAARAAIDGMPIVIIWHFQKEE